MLKKAISFIVTILVLLASSAIGVQSNYNMLYGKWIGKDKTGKAIYLLFDPDYISIIQVGNKYYKWAYSVDWSKSPAFLDIDLKERGKIKTIIEVTAESLRFENNKPGINRPLKLTDEVLVFLKTKATDTFVFDDTYSPPREKLSKLGITYSEDVFFQHIDKGDVEIIKIFLASGMSPNIKKPSGMTALIQALFFHKNTEVALELINAGADVHAKDERGWTPLMGAAYNGDHTVVVELIKRGVDVNASSVLGWSVLMRAVKKGRIETVKELIKAGADVNAKEVTDMTALMIACSGGHPQFVKTLIEAGADVNAKDKHGKTPLNYAEGSNEAIIIPILKQAGAQ